jgi:hypothetical protein
VERAQKTVLDEFYPLIDLDDPELQARPEEWQFHYNWMRGHGSLAGKAPLDRVCARSKQTPLGEQVDAWYDPSKERLRTVDYSLDIRLGKLKGSL